jgi:arylsulfatase A-like enzyme
MTRSLLPIFVVSTFAGHAGALGAAGTPRPNILFIIADDLAACLGCYGNARCQTPHLDGLARKGVRFDRAYCQYPVCGPSRASLMSGLYPQRTRVLGNNLAPGSYRVINPALVDHPSIGGFLRRSGYYSARVSKIYHMGVPGTITAGSAGGDDPDSWNHTVNVKAREGGSAGKRLLLSPANRNAGSSFTQVIIPDEEQAAQADYQAASAAIDILKDAAKKNQPFFLAVGFVRPHVPLVAPQRLFDRYPAAEIKLPANPPDDLDDVPGPARAMANAGRYGMNEDQQRQAIAAYYASVSFMDEQVGRLLAELDRLGLRDNTIIVFTSDHGYNLGEHFCWQKLSLFEESVRVPLIVSAPGLPRAAGQGCKHVVELIDLYPTLAELAGLQDKAPGILQGISLRPLLEDPARRDWKKATAYTVTQGNGASIRTPRWRYNHWGGKAEELYDHDRDPHEYRNLARDPDHLDILKEMRDRLRKARAE